MMGWGQGCENLDRFGPAHMWGGGLGIVGPLLGLLFLLGFLALLVVGVIVLARRTGRATGTAGGGRTVGSNTTAVDLLQNRLAAGDISLEEYHRLRDELRS